MECSSCGATVTHHEWRYQRVRYPYNPEWPVETVRAGVACSAKCLAALVLNDDSDALDRLAAPQPEAYRILSDEELEG